MPVLGYVVGPRDAPFTGEKPGSIAPQYKQSFLPRLRTNSSASDTSIGFFIAPFFPAYFNAVLSTLNCLLQANVLFSCWFCGILNCNCGQYQFDALYNNVLCNVYCLIFESCRYTVLCVVMLIAGHMYFFYLANDSNNVDQHYYLKVIVWILFCWYWYCRGASWIRSIVISTTTPTEFVHNAGIEGHVARTALGYACIIVILCIAARNFVAFFQF